MVVMQNLRALEDAYHPPFAAEYQLVTALGDAVPGQPILSLNDEAAVVSFLVKEISTERLERMYGMLFLVSNYNNISPLHHQLVKGRQILITERADLHLVWHYDRIFIKPLTKCLLNHHFWKVHLRQDKQGSTSTTGADARVAEKPSVRRTSKETVTDNPEAQTRKKTEPKSPRLKRPKTPRSLVFALSLMIGSAIPSIQPKSWAKSRPSLAPQLSEGTWCFLTRPIFATPGMLRKRLYLVMQHTPEPALSTTPR